MICWCLQCHEDLGILGEGCSGLASRLLQGSWVGVEPLNGTTHLSVWPSTKQPQQILRNLRMVAVRWPGLRTTPHRLMSGMLRLHTEGNELTHIAGIETEYSTV